MAILALLWYNIIMDKKSSELAMQMLEIQHREISPMYEQARQVLYGELAASTLRLAGLREETRQRQGNMALIRQAKRLLPIAQGHYDSRFELSADRYDLYDVRLLQASTLWNHDAAHYMIGHWEFVDDKGQRQVELLCISADDENDELFTFETKPEEFAKIKAQQSRLLASGMGETAVSRIYDHASGGLIVHGRTAGNIKTRSVYSKTPFIPALDKIGSRRNYIFGDLSVSHRAMYEAGPTDAELARYQVPEFLGRLATAFGAVDQYDALLSASHEIQQPRAE